MRNLFRRIAVSTALLMLVGLLIPLSASAQTTYEIQVGQSFFEQGVPGFSARVYPGSIRVHSGDMIHFDFGVGLIPNGEYHTEWIGEHFTSVGQDWFPFQEDPDDPENQLKFNPRIFEPGSCGAQDNPCEWSGNEGDLVVPGETEAGDMWVRVTAPAGTTMWAASGPFGDHNVGFKVEVVGNNDAASNQANLDRRGAELMRKDYEDALAMHKKMNAKRTSHINRAGQKVYDVWVGATGGPIGLFAMYPRRISIPRGSRVQFHFQEEIEPHTATFGGAVAMDIFRNGFMPVCDPDGDDGRAPDQPATFGDDAPPCADMSQFEIDIDDRIPFEVGDRRMTTRHDYENSGFKFPQFPEESTFDASPWTVKFPTTSNRKGFRYICLIHGPFMNGRVRVR